MIVGTTLRQGRLVLARSKFFLDPTSGNSTAAPLSTALARFAEPSTLVPQHPQARSFSIHNILTTSNPNDSRHYQPRGASLLHQSLYHTTSAPFQDGSAPFVKGDAPTLKVAPLVRDDAPKLQVLTPSLRAAIVDDLNAVDFDKNGRIDAEELKALLRKYGNSFREAEILELGELFYTSLGASSVDIHRFVEALDAAAAEKGTSGGGETEGGEVSPLAKMGKFKTHPLGIGTCASEYMFSKSHGVYKEEDLNIEVTHVPPVTRSDKLALFAVRCVRFGFDNATLWNFGKITKNKILNRAIFLETIAAIPGMVAAVIRHFRSLRNMARDGGMLNMFIEEANNERMHLLTFIRMKEPGYIFRVCVIGAQAGFGTFFLAAYMISPTWCHRFIGYIEEEAVHTYTTIIEALENAEEGSELAVWRAEEAPKIAKGYWKLGEAGNVYDVMRVVRADEAEHRDVNHAVSGVADDTVNPLFDPRVKLDKMLKKYVKDIMHVEATKQSNAAS